MVFRFLSILFWGACLTATAQSNCSYKLTGRITHASDAPLFGAVVYVQETHTGATSDEKGRYVIENICAGKHTLICRYVGHLPDTVVITVTKSTTQNFLLTEAPETLETVVVQASPQDSPTLLPQQTLQGIELQKVQGASLGEMLKVLPGLNSIQTGPSISKPVIHGLHSNRVLILNNGIRQEGQQWGSEHAPEIDPFVAKKVTVVKGAAGVRYGADAIGGVILVEPEALPTAAPIHGEVNLQALSNNRQGTASALLEGGVTKWNGFGWRIQGTFKKAGTSQTPDYYLTNTQFQEQNFSASAGYKGKKFGASVFYSHFSTQLGIFSGAHIGNQTDLEKALQSDRPLVASEFAYSVGRPYQDVSHDLLKAQLQYNSSIGKWSLISGYQNNFRQEWDRPSALRNTNISFRIYTYTNELLLEHKPLAGNITGTIGLSTVYQGNSIGGNVRLIPNFNSLNLGAFVIERWAKEQWELEAGLRYDYRQLDVYRRENSSKPVVETNFAFTNLAASVGAMYQPHTNLEFRLNLSSAWRPPTAAELYSDGVHHGAAAYEKGDTSLTTERSYHATLSMTWTISDRLSAEVGMYYNYMPGYIYLKPDSLPQLTIRGAFPAYTYTQTDAAFRGVDVSATYHLLSWLSWQGKLAMVRARNLTSNEYLPWIPTDRIENTLRAEWKKWKQFSNLYFSVGTLNVSKQRRIPPTYSQTTEQNGVTRTLYIGDFAPPPPGYMLFQADAGVSFLVRKRVLDVSLSAQNLTNVRYRDYLNRFRYFADEMGRNVTLKLKYSF